MSRGATRRRLAVPLLLSACVVRGAPLPEFDEQALRQRGIDPALAQYLSNTARFTEGVQPVKMTVNGQPHGPVQARFDAEGALCFDAPLLTAVGLKALPISTEPSCPDLRGYYSPVQIELFPQRGEVDVRVPDQALLPLPASAPPFSHGGSAGVLNYDLQALHNRFQGGASQFWSAATEAGFNADDWVVRSRQLFTQLDGQLHVAHLDAYGQRSFVEQQALLQAGQINLDNAVLAGARVVGAQWLTEPALVQLGQQGRVEGSANSQARVEVHQGGALIYSTVVPPGPFALGAIPRLDPRREVEVNVIESDGSRRTTTLSAAALGADLPARGFSLGAGLVRQATGRQPWVVSGGWSQPLARDLSVSSGALLAEGYQAVGSGLSLRPLPTTRVQGLLQLAQAPGQDVRGTQGSLSVTWQADRHWSASVNGTLRSRGYRELGDTLLRSPGGSARSQYAVGASWSPAWLGSVSLGLSNTEVYDGRRSTRGFASWGRRIGTLSLAANADWRVSGEPGLGNALYLSASVPLGERRRLRTSWRSSAGQARLGSSLQTEVDERLNYRLGVERSQGSDVTGWDAGVALLPSFAQLDIGYASQGAGNQSVSAAMRGGMVVQGDGLTLSSYPLQDTFAVLNVGDLPGIRLDTPSGVAWTDKRGRAVIAQVTAFAKSPVQVVGKSLPRNVDVAQGAAVIEAARGAVTRLRFAATRSRRVLLTAVLADGSALPGGALVSDGDGELVTLVQEGGLVFVPDLTADMTLRVKAAGAPECELKAQLPAAGAEDLYFETAPAVCHAP